MSISIRNRDVQIIFVEELTEHMAENAAFRCRREEVDATSSLIDSKDISSMFNHFQAFFPRAYERRVLLIAGVCYTSSHLHKSSSHLHIYISSSHLHIFTSKYHLHIFSSSHLHISSSHLQLHILSSLSLSPSFPFLS